jgi:hypothetical protein
MLIQIEEGTTAYRDTAPETERHLLNHLSDDPIIMEHSHYHRSSSIVTLLSQGHRSCVEGRRSQEKFL